MSWTRCRPCSLEDTTPVLTFGKSRALTSPHCPFSSPDDWRHTGSGDAGAVEKFSNFFTNARIHQIREMQEQVAHETGIPAFDFGEIWEGWQSHQQMVHPLLVRSLPPLSVLEAVTNSLLTASLSLSRPCPYSPLSHLATPTLSPFLLHLSTPADPSSPKRSSTTSGWRASAGIHGDCQNGGR